MAFLATARTTVDRIYVWSNRQPWLFIRRGLWVLTFGWALCVLYLLFAAVMLVSIIFAPFSYQAFRMALLALDGGIILEPFSQYIVLSLEVRLVAGVGQWHPLLSTSVQQ